MSARKHRFEHFKQNYGERMQVYHETHEVEVPQIKEPMPVCSICKEPITAIIEAIRESDNTYSHFDCVLKKLTEEYNVKEPDKISYVGHGCFAVVSQNEDGTMFFKERIQYESNEAFAEMKKFVEDSKQ